MCQAPFCELYMLASASFHDEVGTIIPCLCEETETEICVKTLPNGATCLSGRAGPLPLAVWPEIKI